MTEVAIALVWSPDHRFLVVGRRRPGADLAGFAEFPGGKILAGESPQAAIQREVYEETGLDIRVLARRKVVDWAYPHDQVRLHFFDGLPIVVGDDHLPALSQPFKWLTVAEVLSAPLPPANAAVLAELRASPRPTDEVTNEACD